jgi:glycosyltransferase involved in cell wall biosynthesis
MIFFPGMLTGEAKWGAFYGAEAFILPSHQENFGIAVAEALACGKPVLISNQVNIWHEINKSSAGLVENDNLSGVINLLEHWMQMTNGQKNEMGANALFLYKNQFDAAAAAKQMLEELAKVNS